MRTTNATTKQWDEVATPFDARGTFAPIQNFGTSVLKTGVQRSILGLVTREGALHVGILAHRGADLLGRILVFIADVATVRRAIDSARAKVGRHDAGVIRTGTSGLVISCWSVRRPGTDGVVCFGRLRDGEYLGGPLTLKTEEIDRLERAIAWLETETK